MKRATATLVFLLLSFAVARADDVRVPVLLDRPAGVAAKTWPVTFGVPFKQGQCKDAASLTVVDEAGKPVPCQIVKTADWKDGSLRWVLVDLTADFSKKYTVTVGPRAESKDKIGISEREDGGLVINTGAARYEFSKAGGCFDKLLLPDETLVSNAARAFYIVDSKGRRSTLRGTSLKVELAGERHSVIRVEGEYLTDQNERVAAGIVYYHFYAGLPWVRISHKMIVTEDTRKLWFRDLGLDLPVNTEGTAAATFNSGHDDLKAITPAPLAAGDSAIMLQDDFPHFHSETSHFSLSGTFGHEKQELATGAACGDWADLSSERWGIAAQLPGFAEKFPKAFSLSSNRLTVKFWAQECGRELDFRTTTLVKQYFGADWIAMDNLKPKSPESDILKSEVSAKATARTHELWLYPHAGKLSDAVSAQFGATVQEIYAMPAPEWIAASGVMGPWHVKDVQRFPGAEAAIEDYYDRLVPAEQKIFPKTGYLYWGCYPFGSSSNLDLRNGRWYPQFYRLSRCLEYNFKRSIWILYARSGERAYHDYARDYTRLQHDLLWSNCDYDAKYPKGRLYQAGEFKSPILWGGDPGYIAFASSEDVIQFVYDYFLAGDYHSRDMVLWWKAAMIAETKFDAKKTVAAWFPPVVILRMVGSAYELDHDQRLYDFGHAMLQEMVNPADVSGLKPEVKQNFGKVGDVYSVFYYYYVSTGDDLCLTPLTKLVEFYYRYGRINFMGRSSMEPFGFAYAWRKTKDPAFVQYMASYLHQLGEGPLPLKALGLDLSMFNQKFNRSWGHSDAEATGPMFIGMPVMMQAVLDSGLAYSPRPLAEKPYPTARTYLLLKREKAADALLDVYVNNVGERKVEPKLYDAQKHPAALEVVSSSEYRVPKPPGVPGYDNGMYSPYYNGGYESLCSFRLKIPASVPPGIYHLDLGDEVGFKLLNSDIEKVLQVAPDGLVLKADAEYYFTVPAGVPAVDLFYYRPIHVFDPDGKEGKMTKIPGPDPDGKYRLQTAGRGGVWSIRTGMDSHVFGVANVDSYVRMLNIPFILAEGTPSRIFDVDASLYPSSEDAAARKIPDSKKPSFVASKFGQGVFFPQRTVAKVPLDPKELPLDKGTVEFWWRPGWSQGDIDFSQHTQRLQLLNLEPISINWWSECPNSGRTPYYSEARLSFGLSDKIEGYTYALLYPVAGKWYHIAVTWNLDGKNSEMDIYINGRKKGYDDYHNGLPRNTPASMLKPTGNLLKFGCGRTYGWVPSGETFDELRISKVVRYTADFVPPTEPFKQDADTLLLLHLDGALSGILNGRPITGSF